MREQTASFLSPRLIAFVGFTAGVVFLAACGGGSDQTGVAGADQGRATADAVSESVLDRGVTFTASGVGNDGSTYRINYSVLPIGTVENDGQAKKTSISTVSVFRNGAFMGTNRRTTLLDPATGEQSGLQTKEGASNSPDALWRTEIDVRGARWACVDSMLAPDAAADSGLAGSRCMEVDGKGAITGRFKGHLDVPEAGGLHVEFVGSGRHTGSGA